MRSLFFIFLLLLTTSSALAEPVEPINPLVNTKISGFYINQDKTEVINTCSNILNYEVVNYPEDNLLETIECNPNAAINTSEYNLLVRGKPNNIMLLLFKGKVIGIHILYYKELIYKKDLAIFLNSNIIESKILKIPSLGDVKTYINPGENWIGWTTRTGTWDQNTETNETFYIIHLEYLIEELKWL